MLVIGTIILICIIFYLGFRTGRDIGITEGEAKGYVIGYDEGYTDASDI